MQEWTFGGKKYIFEFLLNDHNHIYIFTRSNSFL